MYTHMHMHIHIHILSKYTESVRAYIYGYMQHRHAN